jgi:hypothetical protein
MITYDYHHNKSVSDVFHFFQNSALAVFVLQKTFKT